MSDTILRKSPKILYHNHVKHFSETPIIFHKDLVCDLLPCQLNAHESVEFLYVVDGEGFLELDGRLTELKVGDLAVCNSFIPHRVICDDSIRYYCLIVEKRFYSENSLDFSKAYFQPIINDKLLSGFFEDIFEEYKNNNKYKQAGMRSTVLRLLVHLCRNYIIQKPQEQLLPGSDNNAEIHKAIIYIKNNLQNTLTLDEIAAQAQISKYHFSRLFKETTGFTVFTYINNLRCEHAKTLLTHNTTNIQKVAAACGFNNISYFTKTFKTYTSLTPSQFIKINNS